MTCQVRGSISYKYRASSKGCTVWDKKDLKKTFNWKGKGKCKERQRWKAFKHHFKWFSYFTINKYLSSSPFIALLMPKRKDIIFWVKVGRDKVE